MDKTYKTQFDGLVLSVFYFFTLALSCFLFFKYSQIFDWLTRDYEPVFLGYSREIYYPQHMAKVMFWGESILLPLMVQMIGASKPKAAYFFFCGIIYIAIIPTFAYFALQRFKSPLKALIFTLLLVGTFPYLRQMDFSSSDFLTILLMGISVISGNALILFAGIVLASLSHFSITIVSSVCLIPIFFFSPILVKKERLKNLAFLVSGLIVGRSLLALWYWKFDYLRSGGRVDYVIDLGVNYFINRYLENPEVFWLMPQISFLIPFIFILFYFAYLKNYLFCCAAIFSLLIAYISMFFTLDGYRIFATVMAAPYIYLLLSFIGILNLNPKIKTRPSN
jgi:hypothetical protein